MIAPMMRRIMIQAEPELVDRAKRRGDLSRRASEDEYEPEPFR
jgi:hypothetical protein